MATSTSKLALRKPATTDNVSVETDLNQNYDKIDAAMGTYTCTAATRPTTGNYTGRLIFETDTSRLLVRTSGNQWKTLSGRTNISDPVLNSSVVTIAAASAINDYNLNNICIIGPVTSDGISTYEITGSWPGVLTGGTQADPYLERSGLSIYLHRYSYTASVYSNSATLNTAFLSREIGFNATYAGNVCPGGSGTLVANDTPPAGTFYYAMRVSRYENSITTGNSFKIQNSSTSPSRLRVIELEGALY
jgi:hypothetical protein